ncbi:MAG: zinc ABC transporter solute-binding protein [Alphaproteobacteria bacterium]|jgi:zinc transport system substrate-binding protein|nr:zinc ABC transporter solute-binding protein [Alphaproteobacteria bacterium]
MTQDTVSRLAAAIGFAGLALAPLSPAAAEDGLAAVATIKPVQSLAAAVMGDRGSPHLLIRGAASPHVYSFRPSDAEALQQADIVFWVGPALETFLVDPLVALAEETRRVTLAEAPGVTLLAYREGGPFAAHDHAGEGEDHGHDTDHAHDHGHEHDGHDHDHDHDHDHAHHDDHGHDHGVMDMHLWLDPDNAAAMVAQIRADLTAVDPAHEAAYAARAEAVTARLQELEAELQAMLAPVRDRPFIVFHDAYQYLEHAFDLTVVGSLTVSPDRQPGAARVAEIRRTLAESGAVCVFAEPQFEPRLVEMLVAGTNVRSGVLDPLGADLEPGPALYFTLMRRNAEALVDCLSQPG